jgi:D-glycero-alpha-D-manno-heptose-7-phosphate kinase
VNCLAQQYQPYENMIISRTPFRLSFFGGGTDYPAWFRERGGAVLATTLDKYCYISVRVLPPFFEHRYRVVYSAVESVREISEIQHPAVKAVLQWHKGDTGLEIHHDGDLPARSGLGSSSSFTVGLINALKALDGRLISKEELARDAIHVEQYVIKEPVGSQDQISAAFGGFNRIEFKPDGTFDVLPIILPRQRLEELQQHLMLFFTGVSRYSADVAQSKIANLQHRTAELTRMREMVEEAIDLLRSDATPIEDFGRMLHESWMLKRTLSGQVTTSHVDGIYEAAMQAGALGGKVLGAGGGGFMAFFVPPDRQTRVREALEALSGLIHVPFKFESAGSRIVLYQPNGL